MAPTPNDTSRQCVQQTFRPFRTTRRADPSAPHHAKVENLGSSAASSAAKNGVGTAGLSTSLSCPVPRPGRKRWDRDRSAIDLGRATVLITQIGRSGGGGGPMAADAVRLTTRELSVRTFPDFEQFFSQVHGCACTLYFFGRHLTPAAGTAKERAERLGLPTDP